TASALGALPAWAADAPAPLKEVAASRGMRFGSAAGVFNSIRQPQVAALLARECDLIVPENELKMYVTHNSAASYNFAPGDEILNFCTAHGMAMRGHNLFWARDEYTPQWLKSYDFGSNPKVTAEKLLRDYIAIVTDHYGTRLTSWDVINETVDPATGEVRVNAFTRVLGMDALRIAFEAAREHLPKMQLVYNDYMCWETQGETHRKGVLKLMRWFHDNHVPVDALGLQSHIGTDHDLTTGNSAAWKAFLDEVTGMGYGLLITEFDVNDKNLPADIAVRDAKVAETARAYLDLTLSYKQLKDVLVWGIDDRYSWLQDFTKRPDGQRLRPTPYDDDFKPKPLREAIAAAFRSAPAR
ncbi:MAG: endo-1,4-beta-xylanase, partial [Asticcacaulis sp.]